MEQRHFRSYGELERRMAAARQLRAQTIAGATRTFAAFVGKCVRGLLGRIINRSPHPFPVGTGRRAAGVDGPGV